MPHEHENVKEDHICSICLTAYYVPVQLASCKHIFCQACIDDTVILMADRRCPLCRTVYAPHQVQTANQLWQEIQTLYPNIFEQKKKTIKSKKLIYLRIGNSTVVHPDKQSNKYEWRLFVKTGEGEKPLKEYAQKVEVNLHPTFYPSKLVYDLSNGKEVELRRIGWGTFRINITVFWKSCFEEEKTEFHHDLNFISLAQKQIGCYLHQKKVAQ